MGIEVWKDTNGYEGLYQASTYGRIKSLPWLANSGYKSKRFIEERVLKNLSLTQITNKFGITCSMVSRIKLGKAWRHIKI